MPLFSDRRQPVLERQFSARPAPVEAPVRARGGDAMAALMAAVRWIARIGGALCAATFLLFLFGEGFGPRGTYTLNPLALKPRELIAMLLLAWACAGLLIGWRREGLGGGIALCSILAFASFLPRGFPLWAILAPAISGFLFLLYWSLSQRPAAAPAD
jgi:hypothetical protein